MYELRKVHRLNDIIASYGIYDDVYYHLIGLYSRDEDGLIDWVEDFNLEHEAGLIADLPLLNNGVLTVNDYSVKYAGLTI